jgi:cytochrome c-type biogenesis protein CcmF
MNFYPSAPNDPIGTPSIHYGALKDLYSSVIGFDHDRATFRLFLNPGVMWLWVGGFVVALGGLTAAWPSRRRLAPLPGIRTETREPAVTAG